MKLSIILRLLPLPSADCCIECSSITILASPPRCLSTRLSVFRCCSMVAKHGPLNDDTSRPLRLSIFAAYRLCLVSAGGRKYHMLSCSRRPILPRVEHLLVQRQLRWLGHVIRLPDNGLPRRLIYGELLQGQRSVGRPKKRFSDYIRITLQKCNIQLSDLEASVSDRDLWCVKRV